MVWRENCPVLEDTKLPPARHWDKDGLPKYLILGLRNWKSRKKENAGKLYPVKIHRNYLDPTYCPVFLAADLPQAFRAQSGRNLSGQRECGTHGAECDGQAVVRDDGSLVCGCGSAGEWARGSAGWGGREHGV